MPKKLDLLGQRFRKLVVIRENRTRVRRRTAWVCICDCGKQTVVTVDNLRSGKTGSCGCHKKAMAVANMQMGQIKPRHGMTGTPEHKTWQGMIERCSPGYRFQKHYFDRGIRVCERWQKFENFYEDMGPRPSREHSIDRVDVNGDYEPSNCRWAIEKTQQRNKQRTRYLCVDGERRPLMDVADELGIKKTAAQYFFSTLKKLRQRYLQVDIKDG